MGNYITPIQYNKTKEQVSINNNDTRVIEFALRLEQFQAQLNNIVGNFTGYTKKEVDNKLNLINEDLNNRVTTINVELQKLQNNINSTRQELTALINTNEIDLNGYIKRTEYNTLSNNVNNIASQINNINNAIENLPNFSNYLTKVEATRNYYNKTEIDNKIESAGNFDAYLYYKKNEIDRKIDSLASNIDTRFKTYYNKSDIDNLISNITGNSNNSYYTKNEIDNRVNSINTSISTIQNKFNKYYTKEELDARISAIENQLKACATDISCPSYTTPCANNTVCSSKTTCPSNSACPTECSSKTTCPSDSVCPAACSSKTTCPSNSACPSESSCPSNSSCNVVCPAYDSPCSAQKKTPICSTNTVACNSNTTCPTDYMCIAHTTTCPNNYICNGNTQCFTQDTSCPDKCNGYVGCDVLEACIAQDHIDILPYKPIMLGKAGIYEFNVPINITKLRIHMIGGGAAGTSNYGIYIDKTILTHIGILPYSKQYLGYLHFYGDYGNGGTQIRDKIIEVKADDLITIRVGAGGKAKVIDPKYLKASDVEGYWLDPFGTYKSFSYIYLKNSDTDYSGTESNVAVNKKILVTANGGAAKKSRTMIGIEPIQVKPVPDGYSLDRTFYHRLMTDQYGTLLTYYPRLDLKGMAAKQSVTEYSGFFGIGGLQIKAPETYMGTSSDITAKLLTQGKDGYDGFVIIECLP